MSLKIEFLDWFEAGYFAKRFWEALPARSRRCIIWNMPEKYKKRCLINDVAHADIICGAYLNKIPFALCWGTHWISNGHAMNVHFAFAQSNLASCRYAANLFIARMDEEERTLIGEIPAPFIGAIKFARSLGFERLGIIPKAGPIFPSERQRAVVIMRRLPKGQRLEEYIEPDFYGPF